VGTSNFKLLTLAHFSSPPPMVQAVIMAAGKSTRTYPLTLTKPKPLLHIANKPILAHQLDRMLGLIDEAIVIVGYKHEMIRELFGDSYRGISLRYVEQKEQLGTGHAAMQVESYIRDRFLLMNGDDLYAREDLEGCLQHHYSLLSMEVEDPRQFGVLTVKNGLVTELIEKPEHPESNLTSVGVYVFDRNIFPILDKIPRSPRGEYEVTDGVRVLAQSADMHYHVSSAYWIPVGFPWSILTANDFLLERDFNERIAGIIEPEVRIEGTVSLGKNSIIRQGSLIQGNLCVGDNCVIGGNCHISGNTSIGDNSSIAMTSRIDNSVIDQHVRIEPFCHISHSVLGDGCVLRSGAVTMSAPLEGSTVTSVVKGQPFDSGRKQLGAILASGAEWQPHVVSFPGVKISPGIIVGAGSVVREDMSS
jgi:UDP-N-acetylglucosamine diphosphorylase / glucose-1-phosphate thymidylyltransferase / UDP-N-acetylgalactosamine diphosphorylase / glucosamine-1-phosphate N-acetyltransferase / galactosamine-1-phosphate N-acetyltransferase